METPSPLLRLSNITKRFPGVTANDRVSVDFQAGEVHALLGENGAGKTTLMNILYGVHPPDAGELFFEGRPVRMGSPAQALRLGIALVPQHPLLVERHTVAENLVLGLPGGFMLSRRRLLARLRERLAGHPIQMDLEARVDSLSAGEKQRLEILRALLRGSRVLILDEPTSVLTPQEVAPLFQQLAQLKAQGLAILFISHKLDEVLAHADRITVLRGGKKVGELTAREATQTQLVRLMLGREVAPRPVLAPPRAGVRLEVKGLEVRSSRGLPAVKRASFSLAPGEVVGIAGVAGSGQRELAEALTGLRPFRGAISLDGQPLEGLSPARLFALGVAHVPEERAAGTVPSLSVAENLALRTYDTALRQGPWLVPARLEREAVEHIRAYQVSPPDPRTPLRLLSGGNIQRVVLARELAGAPRLLIAVHPTYGVDVGATEQVHRLLIQRAQEGLSVVLVTEDLDELLALSHRVAALYQGELRGPYPVGEVDLDRLGRMMTRAGEDVA
ncbi:ABC transporter ATP-binding protein [Stigmatella aurantiaca]|uniref:Sugar ABC transporter, ATP-binding protein n=2 Tax=Stigmatella aurantiaca (strain DW4/3-1) TaxID=378806 RepID=E3FM97_STIAD|nr:ABC transporter ATP-binding protein [Stigmatella aurantiaca]ADO69296.1 Sugar ABC transporter, ATP-binding protein [Stigmatella aurantiaca DW4/3-1]